MALETKDLDPVITGIGEIKAEQKTNATAVSEVKAELASVKTDVTGTKTEVSETKASVETIKTETGELKEWRVKKDESDTKRDQAIDKMLADKRKKPYSDESENKSFSQQLGEALNEKSIYDNIEAMGQNKKDREKKFSFEIKAVGDMSVGVNYSGGTAAFNIIRPGYVMGANRKVHVRSLVPNGTVGAGTTYVFGRENGAGEGSIAPTAETATKPQFDLDLIEATVNIETIAGWMRVTRKMMNNVPGFISYLQARLPEKLLNVEDAQLLQGNGISPNIKGIMTAGNFTAATSGADVLVEQLMDSISQLEEADRSATGITLRPADWMSLFKNKATGSGEYDTPSNVVFLNNTLYIAGVPIYSTTAMPTAKYIVGDFQMGAQLLTQESMRIEFFEQDGTNVRENKITVRIEETIAFPVFGSDFFIVGDVPAGS